MKWHKNHISIENIPKIINQIELSIKNGDPILEKIRCVYTEEESNIIYCLTPFDFVDEIQEELKIKTLCTYQVLEN